MTADTTNDGGHCQSRRTVHDDQMTADGRAAPDDGGRTPPADRWVARLCVYVRHFVESTRRLANCVERGRMTPDAELEIVLRR
jgi:hypothetical protein